MNSDPKARFHELSDLGLFPEDIQELVSADAIGQAVAVLVERGSLTPFQAQRIERGEPLVLGNYLLLDRLGEGGMGTVFKARHLRMDRVVALKVLSQRSLEAPDAIKRFQREVHAAARLSHPNIVTAFDADEANGAQFLVMEYVEGVDLSTLIKRQGPMSLEEALECTLQAARGLEYAHSKGIVHRDIKPANLLLSTEGQVKILDMGLARLESTAVDQAELTGTGQVMGTVDYMAPEQAVDTKHADERADLYSLGITLWYLLTSRPAYGGDTLMARLVAHREQPIPSLAEALERTASLSARGRELSDEHLSRLDAVFSKMVAKRPQDRHSSMTHVIADLQRCLPDRGAAPTVTLKIAAAAISQEPTGEETVVGGIQPAADTDPTTNVSLGQVSVRKTANKNVPRIWKDWRVITGIALSVALIALAAVISDASRRDQSASSRHKSVASESRNSPINVLPKVVPQPEATASSAAAPFVPTGVPPVGRHALQFDGEKSVVQGPADWTYDGSHPLTIEAWIYQGNVEADSTIAQWGPFALAVSGRGKSYQFAAMNGDLSRYIGHMTSESVFESERWVHLAGQWTGKTTQLYWDGKPQVRVYRDGETKRQIKEGEGAELVKQWAAEFKDVPLVIGQPTPKLAESIGLKYAGLIRAVRISKSARYDGWFLPPATFTADEHTLALYDFSEGAGEELKDKSGQGRHATIAAAKWVAAQPGVADFRSLLDGPNLRRWNTGGDRRWRMEAGPNGNEIVFGAVESSAPGSGSKRDKGSGLLILNEDPGVSFNLQFEAQVLPANHTVRLVYRENPEEPSTGYRVQIGDSGDGNAGNGSLAFRRSGGGLTFGMVQKRILGAGQWHHYHIHVRGGHQHRVYIDGQLASNTSDYTFTRGRLYFTAGASTVLRLRKLEIRSPDMLPPRMFPGQQRQAAALQDFWSHYLGVPVEYENGVGMKFILIPPGLTVMGFSEEERRDVLAVEEWYREWLEKCPGTYRVSIPEAYYMGLHEVRQDQYQRIMGNNPSAFAPGGDEGSKISGSTWDHPVENLTWPEMLKFANALSAREGLPQVYNVETLKPNNARLGYHLPTEAQWEHAARAGSTNRYFFGDAESALPTFAWFKSNSQGRTHPVGQLQPNPFGLFDVYGNVWECCEDRTGLLPGPAPTTPEAYIPLQDGDYVITKGGFYENHELLTTSATRARPPLVDKFAAGGFRLVLPANVVKQLRAGKE